jgi:hypothetical protein
MRFLNRLAHAWNAFTSNEKDDIYMSPPVINYGYVSSYPPYMTHFTKGNERSIVAAIYNRIAVDVSNVEIKHSRLDLNGRYSETIQSGLNDCLTIEANKDQTAKAFVQDIAESMMDEGVIAIVPVDTVTKVVDSVTSDDILSMRVGKITEWYADYVKVDLYNDTLCKHQEIIVKKSSVAIIENPFYAIMNEHNSTLQRLITKLNILDAIDKQSGSGKLDLIVQLPYVVKTPARKQQAQLRRQEIEDQLSNSKYGIAYTDGTEKVTQLNRSVENNLLTQIQYLTSMLYSQLGITQAIMDGTADEKTMLNYMNRTVIPILDAIVKEFRRKFLTKTARSQKQDILYFSNPFKLMPISNLADVADKFTRNEIMSSNEIRQLIGMKPSSDPNADALRNKNMPIPSNGQSANEAIDDQQSSVDNENSDSNSNVEEKISGNAPVDSTK